jgi:hypothetical protein
MAAQSRTRQPIVWTLSNAPVLDMTSRLDYLFKQLR